MDDEIGKIRQSIDKIDRKIAKLLSGREEQITKLKSLKQNKKLPIRNMSREKEILEKLESDYQKNIFRKILSESRKFQQHRLT